MYNCLDKFNWILIYLSKLNQSLAKVVLFISNLFLKTKLKNILIFSNNSNFLMKFSLI